MKRKQTRRTDIPKRVKDAVFARDGSQCVICGRYGGLPSAHFISRAQGGLGVEENIVTLCFWCHRDYDQTDKRMAYRKIIREYLQSKYPDWDESKLYYRKENGNAE